MTLKARITAIDRFIKGCREDGIYDDLNACCVMAGWDSLAGALTPLKGATPTNSGFIATDYDRGGIGIAGDGTSYINSNRDNSDDGQDDQHLALFVASPSSDGKVLAGRGLFTDATTIYRIGTYAYFRNRSGSSGARAGAGTSSGFYGSSRNDSSQFYVRAAESTGAAAIASTGVIGGDIYIFTSNGYAPGSVNTDATLAFYSIGSSLGSDPATGLAALDARVSTLMADLRAIEETGFDRDAIAYIRAVEEADGAYLETDVKIAVNNLVSGLKADDLWDAIGSSCLLCGPRTLAGALVPLRGDAPTAEGGWASGDYDRATGMKGNGTSLYLSTGVNNSSFTQDDFHMACYVTEAGTAGATRWLAGAGGNQTGASEIFTAGNNYQYRNQSSIAGTSSGFADTLTGLMASSRYEDEFFDFRAGSLSSSSARVSQSPYNDVFHIFKTSYFAATNGFNGRLAYYSLGSQVDMGTLRTHLDAYLTAIGAAV
jgi:hypothetical protein